MAHPDIYAERFGRHAIETERMDQQFEIITGALGWLLHPSITRALGDSPSIADVATGTGQFLRLLSKTYPSARLDGYDVSSAMFNPDEHIHMSIANAKEPFPAEFHGVYDLVHVRYLVAGMEPTDWEPVLRNMLQILKPGGAIQWVEPALSQSEQLRGEPSSTTTTMTRLSSMFRSGPIQQRFSHGWNTLPGLMEKCGLRVETDLVSSDRIPGTRRALTENAMVAALGFARMMTDKQAPGSMSTEQIQEAESAAIKDIESGCYIRYNVHTAIGFKPD